LVRRFSAVPLTLLLALLAAGCSAAVGSSSAAGSAAGSSSPGSPPQAMGVATAKMPSAKARPAAGSSSAAKSSVGPSAASGLDSYKGSLILDDSGSQLTGWNSTSSYCPQTATVLGNGTVGTDSSGDVSLTTPGKAGSCAALISPGSYSSDVIEADIYLPALPGQPDTVANWTSFWMTDGAKWPESGELDGVEVEPVDATNAVTWHSGTPSDPFDASTSTFSPVQLPTDSGNLSPGWHVVDMVYTKGFFAIYYDGREFTSFTSSNVTGWPLNVYVTTIDTPASSAVEQQIGSKPINSDPSAATVMVKYLKIWSYR
jgi:hypothetical protein